MQKLWYEIVITSAKHFIKFSLVYNSTFMGLNLQFLINFLNFVNRLVSCSLGISSFCLKRDINPGISCNCCFKISEQIKYLQIRLKLQAELNYVRVNVHFFQTISSVHLLKINFRKFSKNYSPHFYSLSLHSVNQEVAPFVFIHVVTLMLKSIKMMQI